MIILTSRRSPQEQERYENTDRLISAAYNGMLWEVEKYIPISNVDGFESKALKVAIERGHLECAKALIPHTSTMWVSRFALRTACQSDQTAFFETLVPHTQHKDVLKMMVWLLNHNRKETAQKLYKYVDYNDVVKTLQRFIVHENGLELLEELQAQRQKDAIETQVVAHGLTSTQRKI